MKKRVFRERRKGDYVISGTNSFTFKLDEKANTIEVKAIKEKPKSYKKGAKNGNNTTNSDN